MREGQWQRCSRTGSGVAKEKETAIVAKYSRLKDRPSQLIADMHRLFKVGTWVVVLAFGLPGSLVVAGETSPKEKVGISASKLQSIALESQLEGVQSRQLRMRKVTLEPGGHNILHSHAGRPAVIYVLEGAVTEHRNGTVVEHPAGDSWFADKDVNHWIENNGTTNAVQVTVDIPKE